MKIYKKGENVIFDGNGDLVLSKNKDCINIGEKIENILITQWNIIFLRYLKLYDKIKLIFRVIKFIFKN